MYRRFARNLEVVEVLHDSLAHYTTCFRGRKRSLVRLLCREMIAARLLFSESVTSRITLPFLPSVKGSSSSIAIVNHSMQVSTSSIMMESPVTMEGSEAAEVAATHDDVYSEWKLSLKSEGAQRVVVNSNYQNTDFRSPHHGMSVIDPAIYFNYFKISPRSGGTYPVNYSASCSFCCFVLFFSPYHCSQKTKRNLPVSSF